MLVLSRKTGQTIQIGDNITVTITQVKGKNIRIGIDAPPEVPIRRGELEVYDRKSATPTGDSIGFIMPACESLN